MRKVLLIIALLITSICQAQETLFRIISVKGIVTLDGDTVQCGQRVMASNLTLLIKGKADYATILSEKGFAFLLSQGKYAVSEISKAEHSRAREGAVHREFSPLRIAGEENSNGLLFGDSLTVIVRPYRTSVKEYKLIVADIFTENILESDLTSSHIHVLKISDLYGTNDALVFHMEGNTRNIFSREHMAKKIKLKDRLAIAYNFDCVKESDFIDQELSILALCEIHGLYLDQINHLYQLWKYSQSTGKKITHAYYKRLFKDYELAKFLPVPLAGD